MIIRIPEDTTHLALYAYELLGTPTAQVWIGHAPDGPPDNDDERVARERAAPHHRIAGIEAMDIAKSTRYPGWYEIPMHDWKPGTYRWNIHSHAHVQAPNGSALRDVRDGEYSWPEMNDEFLMSLPVEQQQFLYLDPNGAGFGIRTSIDENGTVTPAGNGRDWLPNWPRIKEDIAAHYREKMA